jgi:hypothetical protein
MPREIKCKAFLRGHCKLGSDCPKTHPNRAEVCRHFQSTGHCKFGEGCWYIHWYPYSWTDFGPWNEIGSRAASHGASAGQSVNLDADTDSRPVSDREPTYFSESSSSGRRTDVKMREPLVANDIVASTSDVVKIEDYGKVSDRSAETSSERVDQQK